MRSGNAIASLSIRRAPKHHEIARFTEEHGVNVDWLLTGEGRVFTKDIPTSKEFAILVATLPFTEQQEIAAKLREMTEGRS